MLGRAEPILRDARLVMLVRALLVLQACSIVGCDRELEPLAAAPRRTHHEARRDAGRPAMDASDELPDAGARDGSTHDAATEEADSAWDPQPHWILLDDLENARDLGGVPLPDGASVAHGQVFRGPPLRPLTAAGCEEVARLGIRTVVDLRIDTERDSSPEASCVTDRARIVLAPLPVPYGVSPADYIADLDTFDSIARVFDRLADATAYPVYFHCTWGRDRTGVLAAVVLRVLGASRADIMKEYLLSSATVGAYPESLKAVLDVLEQRGVESYLAAAGVSRAQVEALRARLVVSVEHSAQH